MNNEGKLYLAHVDYKTQRCQSMREHTENVANFASDMCQIDDIKNIEKVIKRLHDLGKLGLENQQDFHNILKYGEEVHKQGLDHSTAGGRILAELIGDKHASEFMSTIIYFHHGLSDCIDLKSGRSMQEHRKNKAIDIDLIKERFFQIYDKQKIECECKEALKEYKIIITKINSFVKSNDVYRKNIYGDRYFFLGMYIRVLLSLLIDADWTDTACFFQDISLEERMNKKITQKIWEQCIEKYEQYVSLEIQNNTDNKSVLNVFRQEISDKCREAAETSKSVYRLTVPTGSGKTLSSLRFALYHAKRMEKEHIIYIAPFNSILEQNAQEIRKAVGNSQIVLEHHCNVIYEDEEEERYLKLTETWDSPIIVTTAVQILNTIFSSQKSYIRRMHTLCNSVIIFDEVQAIPIKCTELFHEAVNFLSQFCKSTIVLCSATQPSLTMLSQNNIFNCTEMVKEYKKYANAFKRAEIIDATGNEMNLEDIVDFTIDKTNIYKSTLIIVNTINCAMKIYEKLKENCDTSYKIFHLSNNMCPQNKLDVLNEITKILKEKDKRVICVSTQVVEAGVNLSFGCVIRSKAGLDNVVQAAGRCNRHKELGRLGVVYIIQISLDLENLKYLTEINNAQKALQKVLNYYENSPDKYGGTLDSEESIKEYYQAYYGEQLRSDITKFPIEEYGTTLVDLFGINSIGRQQYRRYYEKKYCHKKDTKPILVQAFCTAGDKFEVISNDYKISVVVPYNEEAKALIHELAQNLIDYKEVQIILRKLQRYSVGISPHKKDELNNAICEYCEGKILVLSEGYYSNEIGVVEEPIMDCLTI